MSLILPASPSRVPDDAVRHPAGRDRAETGPSTAHRGRGVSVISLAAMASVIVVAALAWLLLQPAEPATAPGAAQAATGPSVAIEQPWARAATRPEAGTGGTSAVYMTLRNTGSIGDQLLGASSDVADLTEIHRTTVEDGVMKMRPAGPLDVPAGGTLTLEPGGLHVMLTNLRRDLTASEQVTVTLHLERAGDLVVDAEVRAPASQPMSQPMHGR